MTERNLSGYLGRVDKYIHDDFAVSYYMKGPYGVPASTSRDGAKAFATEGEARSAARAWREKWGNVGEPVNVDYKVFACPINAYEKPPVSGPYVAVVEHRSTGRELYLAPGDRVVRHPNTAKFVRPSDADRIEFDLAEKLPEFELRRIIPKTIAELKPPPSDTPDPQVTAGYGWVLTELQHIRRFVLEAGRGEYDEMGKVLDGAIDGIEVALTQIIKPPSVEAKTS